MSHNVQFENNVIIILNVSYRYFAVMFSLFENAVFVCVEFYRHDIF